MNDLLHDDPVTVRKPRDLEPLSVGLRDAARLLGVSERHLQKIAIAGEVPSAMIGGRRVFRVASLDAWLVDQESEPRAGKQPAAEGGDGERL